ncbi:MAG TPA: VIT1/CCC1 transporter family protein [Acidimicrobiales bacterium]|nr:VIT1/CCC1 transporter family protein [Acidimicrobiales bacterium]
MTDLPTPAEMAPPVEHHHRNVSGGVARASVFGVSDGLVSNVSLILGVAGAGTSAAIVRTAGVAGLVAGAFSMAAGEYVSMKAQRELLERELAVERRELARHPHAETVELAHIYMSRGIAPDTAREVAAEMMKDPDTALEAHARDELGIDPSSLGSPWLAAGSSFLAFALGAFIPLIPWLFGSGASAKLASIVLAAVAAAIVGGLLARFTGRSVLFSAFRQVAIATVAASVTYGVGVLLGT